jgi:hypothetical protein
MILGETLHLSLAKDVGTRERGMLFTILKTCSCNGLIKIYHNVHYELWPTSFSNPIGILL